MATDPRSKFSQMSTGDLRPILRQVLDTDADPLHGWTATEIGRSAGTSTAGIYRIAGNALTAAGEQPWSAVVKVIGPPRISGREFDWASGQRELAVYQSGLFASAQSRVRSARCYALETWQDLHFIWLEDLSAAPHPPWLPEYFVHTAQDFGQFNGQWSGSSLPEWTWLNPAGLRSKYRNPGHADVFSRLSVLQEDALGRLALPADVFAQLPQLWIDGEELLAKVEATSKCLCHRDCHAKNLFPMPDTGAGRYTIAVDWDQTGIEYLGADIGLLLSAATKWLELPIEQAAALVDPVFDAYLTGLAESGWSGNEDEVQLTYLTCLGMGEAMRMLNLIALAVDTPASHVTFERLMLTPVEQVFEQWAQVLRFLLTQKERAVQLARRL
jgi:hypothetical protein